MIQFSNMFYSLKGVSDQEGKKKNAPTEPGQSIHSIIELEGILEVI